MLRYLQQVLALQVFVTICYVQPEPGNLSILHFGRICSYSESFPCGESTFFLKHEQPNPQTRATSSILEVSLRPKPRAPDLLIAFQKPRFPTNPNNQKSLSWAEAPKKHPQPASLPTLGENKHKKNSPGRK